MPSTSSDNAIILDTLRQIDNAIDRLMDWSRDITSADTFRLSEDGMKNLAASCMLLQALGEGIKKIDRRTGGALLYARHPDIPWKNIMGMRDHIAHGYFDIDAEFVFDVIKHDLTPLREAIRALIRYFNQ